MKTRELKTKGWFLFSLKAILAISLFVGCEFRNTQKNMLVVTVENLANGVVRCVDQENLLGMEKILCEEFVRFSHAYTPSPLSQPALASILSGYYPFQNNVWNNGGSFLTEKTWTVSELAHERDYATSFFSGGGAIWRKSGFAQGFETFDEYDSVSSEKPYRNIEELVSQFLRWQNNNTDRSFFSVLYVPDIQFPSIQTYDELGLERAQNRNAQLLEVKQGLGKLFQEMKSSDFWNDTFIVVVGLNGITPIDRNSEFAPLNLHSENTQVSFFIKPPRKQRDRGLTWTVDTNVNLVDLGVTLFSFFGQELQSKSVLKGKSLLNFLNSKKDEDFASERPLLIESGWGQWQELSNTRSALLLGKKLFFFQDPLFYFNTLIDQKESIAIEAKEEEEADFKYVAETLNSAGFDYWSGISYFDIRKFKLGEVLWRDGMDDYLYSEFRILSSRANSAQEIGEWLAYHSLIQNRWDRLESLGKAYGRPDWQYVAYAQKKSKKKKYLISSMKNLCFVELLNKERKEKIPKRDSGEKDCQSQMVSALFQWKHGPRERKNYWRETFIQYYRQFISERRMTVLNFVAGLSWDTGKQDQLFLNAAELYLALPENSFYRDIVRRRLSHSPFQEKIRN